MASLLLSRFVLPFIWRGIMEITPLNFVFPAEYERPMQVFSLCSVLLLGILFLFLNRYSQRRYFAIWGAAWLFHALWLTLRLVDPVSESGSWMQVCKHWAIGTAGVFLFWGGLAFRRVPSRTTLFGLLMVFVFVWSFAANQLLDQLFFVRLPLFCLTGLASITSAFGFYQVRKKRLYVGASMLGIGLSFWGIFLVGFPFLQKIPSLISMSFALASVLQLFIGIGMVVLMLEEVQMDSWRMVKRLSSGRRRKRELELKILSGEEKFQTLLSRAQLSGDLKQVYTELRQTQQVVAQQERLRALGQMASGIGHDINNALSLIVAYAQLEMQTKGLSEKSKRHLECIKMAGEDIARIVANIREFYRKRETTEELEPVNLNRIAEQVIAMTRPRWRDIPHGKGISISVETKLANELPKIFSNGSELREAITNLLLNAVDALPKGGTITLLTRVDSGADARYKGIERVILEVRDSGIGMDEHTRKRCLEPFFSTKGHSGGTGLGLAMVFGTVERHKGTIEIESEVGKGTTMRLVFPVYQPGDTDLLEEEHAAIVQTSALRILYIDDEPALRDLMQELLGIGGHSVKVADGGKSGIEAFRAARAQSEPFDIIISDLGMPIVDGRQVALAVKSESPSTPMMLLTGWGSMMEADGHVPEHVDLVLGKPPQLNELLNAIAELTNRERTAILAA
jgi:signal transduction histidine kinase/ActR/RegA family two-component response regulator